MTQDESSHTSDRSQGPALLEWIAGAIGAAIIVGMIGTIGYQAMSADGAAPPEIAVELSSIRSSGNHYIVEIAAKNRSDATAAQVEIEATLTRAGREIETGRLTLDYVPGDSKVEGGIYFTEDPRSGQLELRPLGYSRP